MKIKIEFQNLFHTKYDTTRSEIFFFTFLIFDYKTITLNIPTIRRKDFFLVFLKAFYGLLNNMSISLKS